MATNIRSTPRPAVGEDRQAETDAMVRQFARLMRLLKRGSARVTSQQQDGIEQAAYVLLGHLVMAGPQRTTALAEAVHADTSTVSRQVGVLVRHDLVTREADPADGRACLLVATPLGQELFERQHRARIEDLSHALEDWSSEDLRTAATLLNRLNTALENEEHRQHGATCATCPKGGSR
ncbi:MAG TPA: MarR family winged helix-turn-helix transcriptional regulator [Pseudonocardiaceae bacterium]